MGLAPYNVGHGQPDGPAFAAGRYVLSACAGAAAYRRAFFDRVGGFDEDFFAWFEDVEIGIRGQLAGFRCWYEPTAVVRHLGSATAARMPDRKIFLLIRNNLILFFQTMPLRRVLPWGPVILLWPWLDPIFYGRPLRLTARGWCAFWGAAPRVLRNRRRIYAGRGHVRRAARRAGESVGRHRARGAGPPAAPARPAPRAGPVVNARRSLWLIALAALALRLVLMLARGDYIVYDEGYYLLLARSLRAGHGFALNGLPHVALSPLVPVLVALLSATGLPDLWASRLLAALCGALLVVPVAALARRAGGERAATVAAVLTAASPALMSFVPFFPGQSWNLYFGSEPLFLLLAFGAVAAAMRVDEGRWRWWLATGALAAGAYLTRAEGIVLGPVLFLLLAARVAAHRGGPRAWRGLALAGAERPGRRGAVPVLPAFDARPLGPEWPRAGGRRQRVPATPSAVQSARSAGEILDAFVWRGRPQAFLGAMYGLDATGTRMTSQYWGVHRAPPPGPASAPAPSRPAQPAAAPAASGDSARGTEAAAEPEVGAIAVWWRGLGAVIPWWLGVLALGGLALAKRESLLWALPLGVAGVLPSWLTYVEPRSLLPLAPLAAAFASVTVGWIAAGTPARWRARALVVIPALTALALVVARAARPRAGVAAADAAPAGGDRAARRGRVPRRAPAA